MKLTEAVLQLRRRAVWRVIAHRDAAIRHALRWCYGVGLRAWLFEARSFLRKQRRPNDVSLAEFWSTPRGKKPCTQTRKSVDYCLKT